MEQLDEHEMLVDYSEMTSFNFNSKEFQELKKDYIECKDFLADIGRKISYMFDKIRPAQDC